jgi:alpha-tubulin suppressor-like RCC1 family protein
VTRLSRSAPPIFSCVATLLVAALLASAACGGDASPTQPTIPVDSASLVPPPGPATYSLEVVSGQNQRDTVGAALPLVVRVMQVPANRGASGEVVLFTVAASDGSLSADSAVTDVNGQASITWTLGAGDGSAHVRASLRRLASVVQTFDAQVKTQPLLATALAAGQTHNCALIASGRAYCWGDNQSGELGDGSTVARNVAVPVAGGLTFAKLTVGAAHSCGLTAAGELYCWGSNFWGELGDGSAVSRSTPVRAAPGLTFTQAVAGSSLTCGLTAAGEVYCWGFKLGSNSFTIWSVEKVSAGITFRSLYAGGSTVCGVDDSSVARCMGGVYDLTGVAGGPGFHWAPQQAPFPSATSVASNILSTCALDGAGKAFCWGDNSFATLGNGTTDPVSGVATVVGGHVFSSLVAGYDFFCGMPTTTGPIYCWGNNNGLIAPIANQNFKIATPTAQSLPASISFTTLAAGIAHMCGITTTASVQCWGSNYSGQLGDGTPIATDLKTTPVAVIRR